MSKKTVKSGDKIGVWYVGTLKDGKLFDTNVEDKAKEHNMHNPNRPYEPLEFVVDQGQMIKGFDQGVLGMTINEKKTIEIIAGDAYGERTEERVIKVEKEKIPQNEGLEEGMQVMLGNGQVVKIHKVEDDNIHFDMNHELAGQDLIFEVEVVTHDEKGSFQEESCCCGSGCGCE